MSSRIPKFSFAAPRHLATAGLLALVAFAGAANANANVVSKNHPRHAPSGLRAKAAYLDSTRSVDSLAYCTNSGPLQQMTTSGGIISVPQKSSASTGNPYRVIPQYSGSQWVAFRIKTLANTGAALETTHWYWGLATSPAGYFADRYSSTVGAYLFQDATTGQLLSRVDVGPWLPNFGYGVRFTMDVAWYTGNTITKQISFGIPWTTGNVGAFCWS
jgi:hypothetical protein